MVSEFSQFARMPQVNKAPGNIFELMQETLVLYQEGHKEVSFSCRETAPIPTLNFDSEQIKRCFINLIDNAIAVLPEEGRIDIELTPDNEAGLVFIMVADNGPGVANKNRQKLFEPYFSTKKRGSGLGLSIVERIIRDHDGNLEVEKNLPEGTRFVITLPRIEFAE